MKSFRPKETSCFFKHPRLVAFGDMKGRSGEMLCKIAEPAAISHYFPCIILQENHIITKAATSSLHCLCRALTSRFPLSLWSCDSIYTVPNRSLLGKEVLLNIEIQKKACQFSYTEKSNSTGPLPIISWRPNKRRYSCFY